MASPDHTHPRYAARALRAVCDVILEKPVATSAKNARLLADAARTWSGPPRVSFNYRFASRNSGLRRVIADGIIGKVTPVHFEWVLETVHGADYFRRWHREKTPSGGLLVHKSSHQFDLVNGGSVTSPAPSTRAGRCASTAPPVRVSAASRRARSARPRRRTRPPTRSRSTWQRNPPCAAGN